MTKSQYFSGIEHERESKPLPSVVIDTLGVKGLIFSGNLYERKPKTIAFSCNCHGRETRPLPTAVIVAGWSQTHDL